MEMSFIYLGTLPTSNLKFLKNDTFQSSVIEGKALRQSSLRQSILALGKTFASQGDDCLCTIGHAE